MEECYKFMQNRELSWLKFNLRVLEEASSKDTPILERFKFISIFTSNLDEFFMVRVGSLHDLDRIKKEERDNKTGMSPKEQLDKIYEQMPELYRKRDRVYKEVVEELKKYNINNKYVEDLDEREREFVKSYYKESILPIVSPQIIDNSHPFPFLENKKLYVFSEMWDENNETKYGLVPISGEFEKYLSLPGDEFNYIRIEKIILHYLPTFFPNMTVKSKSLIAVTRNFDFESAEITEEHDNYKELMKKVLKKRQRQEVVRLEISGEKSHSMEKFLKESLGIGEEMIMYSEAPINMKYVYGLMDIIPTGVIKKVSYKEFKPYKRIDLKHGSIMKLIEERDILLSYPYEDIESFLELIKEASEDTRTIAIKITIYRLAKNSKLVDYLINAAQNGIEVSVIMELKARFDEENNINYSDKLYQAGCNIIYGFEKYKTHSKICIISYKDKRDNIRYITQIGTGNYNENTSKQYTDFSLMTANEEIGMDALDFFKNMSISKINGKYLHLLQAPSTLKAKFLRLMDEEMEKGEDGYLRFKMNSLTDKDIIIKLSEASKRGVKIDLIIRGICCILPQVYGYTDNVNVMSIVGRFLEHPRVYQFGKGKDKKVYISSADLMTRNTEKRVEIACPVYDENIKARLVNYLDIQQKDNVKRRILKSTGDYVKPEKTSEDLCAQDYFINEALERREKSYNLLENGEESKKEVGGFLRKLFKKQ